MTATNRQLPAAFRRSSLGLCQQFAKVFLLIEFIVVVVEVAAVIGAVALTDDVGASRAIDQHELLLWSYGGVGASGEAGRLQAMNWVNVDEGDEDDDMPEYSAAETDYDADGRHEDDLDEQNGDDDHAKNDTPLDRRRPTDANKVLMTQQRLAPLNSGLDRKTNSVDHFDTDSVGQNEIESPKRPPSVDSQPSVVESNALSPQSVLKELPISRLPQAIIIGVKKGGTRALLEFLRVHPDVRAPGPEVHFFDRNYHRGLDWYRNQMPPTVSGQVTIEKTPSYFITKAAPSRVFNMSRDTRLIVVVRDPVTRAISDYAQASAKRPGMPSFARMAFLDADAVRNNSNVVDDSSYVPSGPVATSWGAVKIGVYSRHLERWLRFFPRRRVHFVHGERLVTDPAGELAALQDFLGLRRFVTERHFYFNATKGFPCLRKTASKASADNETPAASSPRNLATATAVSTTAAPAVQCLGKNKGRTHPVVDPNVLRRLRDFFRPFNEKFYRQTGINFGWQ